MWGTPRKFGAGRRGEEDPRDWATLVRQYLAQRQDRYLADAIGLVKQQADVCRDPQTEEVFRKLVRLLEAFRAEDLETVMSLSEELEEAYRQRDSEDWRLTRTPPRLRPYREASRGLHVPSRR
jgi:hypothetical protein